MMVLVLVVGALRELCHKFLYKYIMATRPLPSYVCVTAPNLLCRMVVNTTLDNIFDFISADFLTEAMLLLKYLLRISH